RRRRPHLPRGPVAPCSSPDRCDRDAGISTGGHTNMAGAEAAAKDTEARVREIICEHLGVGEEEVTREASFIEDLGADSLDIVELVMALEEEYEMEISDEDAEKIRTV